MKESKGLVFFDTPLTLPVLAVLPRCNQALDLTLFLTRPQQLVQLVVVVVVEGAGWVE